MDRSDKYLTPKRSTEQVAYLLLAAAMGATYLLGAALRTALVSGAPLPDLPQSILQIHFGFDQLSHIGLALALAGYAGLLVLAFHSGGSLREVRRALDKANALASTRLGSVLIALAFACLFYLLRNEFVNQDGRAFLDRFLRDVPTKGAHVTHDEMWELYIHSKAWYWASTRLGWTLIQTYQRLSIAAGASFVFVLLRLCFIVSPKNPFALFLAITAGGFMQLFFGDVENYTLTAVLVLAYLYLGIAHLRCGAPLVAPSAVLALAITFHLLAGFLIPSLLYLWWRAMRTHGWRATLLPGAVFAAIVGATLAFFHLNNLPISALFYQSHALGHGGHILLMLARPSLIYYWQQLNLLALLFPSFLLAIPLLVYRRMPATPTSVFLGIATVFLLLLQFTWNATLGVYNDWNLFAIPSIPFSLLVWSNFVANVRIPHKANVGLVIAGFAALHTFAWILSNRLYGFL
jgi:hypothetical protein